MMKPVYAALLLAGTGLALAACSDGAETSVEDAAPEGIAGLEITNVRMMLPAVTGNPAALYFDIAYDGERNIAIRNADVAGADRAELHDTMEYGSEMVMGEMPPLMMRPGDRVSLEPGGKHVMAFDLSPDLVAGGTTEVTLIVAGGDKHSFEASIQAAGENR